MPALPLDEAGAYVAAAYAVFVVLLVVYVAVMARHVSRVRDDLHRLAGDVARRSQVTGAGEKPPPRVDRALREDR